jgi:hypothetical protein
MERRALMPGRREEEAVLPDELAETFATTVALRPSRDRAVDRFERAVAMVAVLAAVILALTR